MLGQDKSAKARYDFSPYGELMRSAGLPLTVGYTGHRWDPAIGQYFAPFRYYNPQTARWNMRDPFGYVEGPNVYTYVGNQPTRFVDTLGLDPLSPCLQAHLKNYFPDVDLTQVDVLLGIPWFVPKRGDKAGYADPPHHVHVQPYLYSQTDPEGISLIGHELQHFEQAANDGRGRFRVKYILSKKARDAYETDADDVGQLIYDQFKDNNPCGPKVESLIP